jgi:RNA polymerase sigma factor (TIGR02999 family)
MSSGDLVAEVFVRLAGDQMPDWVDRAHFFGIAARLMRQVLVDHARRRGAAKRGSGMPALSLHEGDAVTARSDDVLAVDQALTALAADDERKARVVELHYFGGMSQPEIAEVLDVHVNTVGRELKVAQAWLARMLDDVK